jgi:V8-like Glu-specific endopeptidase
MKVLFMFLKKAVYSILIYASSCSNGNQSESSLQHVFGADDRKVMDTTLYDDLIGYLEGKETKCVGFVSGKDEVTTAAHCIDNMEYPTFILKSGEKFQLDALKMLDAPRDIAVLKTKKYFEKHLDFGKIEQNSIRVVSFNFSKKIMTTSDNCFVNSQLSEYSAFSYECDTSHGNSGSPLIQNGKVVGVHVGYSEKLKANIGVSSGLESSRQVASLGIDFERWPPRIKIPAVEIPSVPNISVPNIPLPNIPGIADVDLINAISNLRNQSRVNYPCVTSALAAAGTGSACVACIVGTEGVGAGVCATMFCAAFSMAIQSVKNNCG